MPEMLRPPSFAQLPADSIKANTVGTRSTGTTGGLRPVTAAPRTGGPISVTDRNAKPGPAQLSGVAHAPNQSTQVTIRGRLDEDMTSSPPIVLPSPEALGLLGQEVSKEVPTNLSGPHVPDFASPSVAYNARDNRSDDHAVFDWEAVQRHCHRYGATAYRLEKLSEGRWRFACVLPGNSEQSHREIEAVADSASAATSAVLQHLAQISELQANQQKP